MYVIYSILNEINGRRYVGSTENFDRRHKDHISTLRGNRHRSYRLQEDFNKYGEEAFKFNEIDTDVTKEERFLKEQYWMDFYKSHIKVTGYNISPTAGNTKGRRHREDAKVKMSESHTGKTLTEDHKKAISETLKTHKKSPEHIARVAEGVRNNSVLTEEKVLAIMKSLEEGVRNVDLAKKYNISTTTVCAIKKGKTWVYLTNKQ